MILLGRFAACENHELAGDRAPDDALWLSRASSTAWLWVREGVEAAPVKA